MAEPARRRAAYEDLLKVPDHKVAEIIDGELITNPRPAVRHARSGSAIGSDLFGSFDGPPGSPDKPGGWWILFEPELHLGRDILVPDLGGWRRERMPSMPSTAFFELPPDWVCEVVSPSSARIDRIQKLRIYAQAHVKHAWIVDPLARTLEVFQLEGGSWKLVGQHESDELVRAPPFDALELDLLALWGETRQG